MLLLQVAPVLVTESLLERLKNNFMIVEVWDKKTSADNDKVCYNTTVSSVKLLLQNMYSLGLSFESGPAFKICIVHLVAYLTGVHRAKSHTIARLIPPEVCPLPTS